MDRDNTPTHTPKETLQHDAQPCHERALIVTGISRSGTSLFSVLLNQLPNVVSFNEVLPLDRDRLLERLPKLRRQILKGRPVWNKFHGDALALDTLGGDVQKQKRPIERPLSEDFWLASNRNLTYLNQLPIFVEEGWRIIALIRDPVFTIASWLSPRAQRAEIPCALVDWPKIHPHLHGLKLNAPTQLACQAQIWEHYARLLQTYSARIHIIPFEHFTQRPSIVFSNLALWLSSTAPLHFDSTVIRRDRNASSRYTKTQIETIRAVVDEYCPTRHFYGYD